MTNVTKFGAFVDIGVHQDGLVHISQLADRFVKDPRDVTSPGDHVNVRVLGVKLERQQIALSMRSGAQSDVAHGSRPEPSSPRSGGPGKGPRPPSFPAPQRPFNNPFAGLGELRGK